VISPIIVSLNSLPSAISLCLIGQISSSSGLILSLLDIVNGSLGLLSKEIAEGKEFRDTIIGDITDSRTALLAGIA
jgi:hypothetical protein